MGHINMTQIDKILSTATTDNEPFGAKVVTASAIDALTQELLKTAAELDSGIILGNGVTVTSNNLAKQRLKETILDGLKSESPPIIFSILRAALEEGDAEQARRVIESIREGE